MKALDRDRTLAMAGIMQAGDLVQRLAHHGEVDSHLLAAIIRSIFTVDAKDTLSVYGGLSGVAMGLNSLHNRLGHRQGSADFEIARYVLSMIQLEGKLRREPEMIERIGARISELRPNNDDSSQIDDELFEQLGKLYTETISLLQPRIIVQGEQGHLAKEFIAARVRATLLAGIRSAYLWAQLGGRRWHLFFRRRWYSSNAGLLLAELGNLDFARGGAQNDL